MPTFNNIQALETYLLKVLADCMNEVGQKVNELLKEHVQTDVYDVGTAMGREHYYNSTKKPTGQLQASVVNDKAEIKGREVSTKVYHDTDLMDYDPDTYLHGSNYWSQSDIREMLPYLINEGRTGGLFGAAWEGLRRPYFSNMYDELVSKDLVRKWMIEALKKRGIKVG